MPEVRLAYDYDLFTKWRKLAVIRKADMRLGDTFWCTNGKHFTLMGWTSEMAHISRLGLGIPGSSAQDIAVSTTGQLHRLAEMNVDAIGTPWLLFRDEATRNACALTLRVQVIIDTIGPV